MARDDADRALAARGDPAELVTEDGTTYRVAFVEPEAEAFDLYYSTVSNPLLWFIQHYLWDLAREPIVDTATLFAWREGYLRVNQMVADRVVAEARASAKPPLVFVQDYQLYCVPGMVRAALRTRAHPALRAHPLADAAVLDDPPQVHPRRHPPRPSGRRHSRFPDPPRRAQLPAHL